MYAGSPSWHAGTLFAHSSKRKGQFVAQDPETGKILEATEVNAAQRLCHGRRRSSRLPHYRVATHRRPSIRRRTRRCALHVASSSTYAQPIILRDRVIVRDASNVTVWTPE